MTRFLIWSGKLSRVNGPFYLITWTRYESESDPDLTLSPGHKFCGGQFFDAHGAVSMEL